MKDPQYHGSVIYLCKIKPNRNKETIYSTCTHARSEEKVVNTPVSFSLIDINKRTVGGKKTPKIKLSTEPCIVATDVSLLSYVSFIIACQFSNLL